MSTFGPGQLFIPDTSTLLGLAISGVNGSALYAPSTAASELGDVMSPSGIMGLLPQGGPYKIFNADYSLRASVANPFSSGGAWSTLNPSTAHWPTSRFYICKAAGLTTDVTSVSIDGVLGGTIWSVPIATRAGLAVNPAATVLYYGANIGGHGLIQAYDLVNAVALPSLYTGAANTAIRENSDIFCLPGGDVVFPINLDTTVDASFGGLWTLQRRTPTGTLVWSVDIGEACADGNDLHLIRDVGDATAFWTRTFPDRTSLTTTFTKRRYADGGAIAGVTVTQSGPNQVAGSCPFFAWSLPVPTRGSLVCDLRGVGAA